MKALIDGDGFRSKNLRRDWTVGCFGGGEGEGVTDTAGGMVTGRLFRLTLTVEALPVRKPPMAMGALRFRVGALRV